jgi:RNA polymerase sigma-70 factor (ECF subfamily)
MTGTPEPSPLIEHLFRRQAGRMVAHLARVLGPSHLDLAEEAVQESMLRALQSWPDRGIPENPVAWLFRVAHNVAIDAVRHSRMADEKTDALVAELGRTAASEPEDPAIGDDELRLIFMCCHPEIPVEAAIALSLKMACGFSIREIARAFLADEAAVAQRLVRAKRQIRDRRLALDLPSGEEIARRLDAALAVIYFTFNEGYTAHEGDALIRRDLCGEALRLARLIAESQFTAPRVDALVALIAFQMARSPARIDEAGDLVLLEEQDRGRWDQNLIALGFHYFDRSIAGDEISAYHTQAAIAATHARAAAAQSTDWSMILALYDQLLEMSPSPVVALNRAVALAKVRGAAEGLAAVEALGEDPKLREYYLWLAIKGHLLREVGAPKQAAECFRAALECRCSEPERRFLRRKLEECV